MRREILKHWDYENAIAYYALYEWGGQSDTTPRGKGDLEWAKRTAKQFNIKVPTESEDD